ncbi:MAG: hypothetical protein HY270_04755 [Deltaproteobacteria bacterium]|nr:hypothetical protein [Deltaproteobacteria bacterium]
MERIGAIGGSPTTFEVPRGSRAEGSAEGVVSGTTRTPDIENADGRNLRKLLEESGHLDWQDVADLGIQLAEALDDRHRQGLRPHRLIMPETVLRTRDGLGYFLAENSTVERLLHSEELIGSEEYRAPEEWRAPDKIDARADQFGLGVVLYEALAGNGKRPFDVVVRPPRGNEGISASYTPRHDLRTLAAGAPEELVRLIERATRLNPNNRFESCASLAASLKTVLNPPAAEWTTPVVPERRNRQRIGPVIILVSVLLAVGLVASKLLVNPPGHSEMEHARQDADRIQAPQFANTAWRQAEMYQPAEAYRQRAELYNSARNQAWSVRLAAVVDAARQAVELGATGEESFQRAETARAQAQQQWTADNLAEASQSLAVADAGFRNAIAARRTQWAGKIQKDLLGEVARLPRSAPTNIVETLRAQQASVQRVLEDAQASPDDLHGAEKAVEQVRQAVTAQVQVATTVASEHREAESSVAAAERLRRSVERLAELSPRTKNAYDQGADALAAARARLEKDPVRADDLAQTAVVALRKVELLAETELATQRKLALEAQRRLDQQRARSNANNGASSASSRSTNGDMDRDSTSTEATRAGAQTAVTGSATSAQTAARVDSAAPAPRPLEPMSATLAHGIQGWMSARCEEINRQADASNNSRARCENLTVLDRQILSKIQISYVLTTGTRSDVGWEWQRPELRRPVLDCSAGACRCVSGC